MISIMQIDCLTQSHQMQLAHFKRAKWCPFFVPTHHVIIIAWSPFLFGDPSSSINKSARKKNFFSWPLSLLLLFYGEFSEWAYAFSWIKLFQLVVFFNVAMHFSVSYFSNFSISVEKKIHSVRDFDLKCFITLMISEDHSV